MAASMDGFVCPVCHGTLASSAGSSTCRGCSRVYPTLGEEIPILVPAPEALVHDAFVRVRKQTAAIARRAAELRAAAQTVGPSRAQVLHRIAEGMQSNRMYADRLLAELEPLTSSARVVDAIAQLAQSDIHGTGTDYSDVGAHLRRDWSREPECEAEVSTIVESVLAALVRYAPSADRVLVVGAGAGRFAYELTAAVPEVIAIDRSLAMAASVLLLRRNTHRLYEICERNVARTEDHIRPFDLAIPGSSDSGASLERMRYAVADALAVPLPSHSVSAVVSIYFTDIVSPSSLSAEVSRLLVPGGLFVHFGPLSYQFSSSREQLSAEELAEMFNASGYRIVDERWVQLSSLASDASMWKPQYRNLCMAAIRNRDANGAAGDVLDTDVLSVHAEPTIQARWRRTGGKDRWIDGSVVSPWGHEVPITEAMWTLLRLVDGRRPLEELLALTESCMDGAVDRGAVRAALSKLLRVGIMHVEQRPAGLPV